MNSWLVFDKLEVRLLAEGSSALTRPRRIDPTHEAPCRRPGRFHIDGKIEIVGACLKRNPEELFGEIVNCVYTSSNELPGASPLQR
jgi:hypothetical protein